MKIFVATIAFLLFHFYVFGQGTSPIDSARNIVSVRALNFNSPLDILPPTPWLDSLTSERLVVAADSIEKRIDSLRQTLQEGRLKIDSTFGNLTVARITSPLNSMDQKWSDKITKYRFTGLDSLGGKLDIPDSLRDYRLPGKKYLIKGDSISSAYTNKARQRMAEGQARIEGLQEKVSDKLSGVQAAELSGKIGQQLPALPDTPTGQPDLNLPGQTLSGVDLPQVNSPDVDLPIHDLPDVNGEKLVEAVSLDKLNVTLPELNNQMDLPDMDRLNVAGGMRMPEIKDSMGDLGKLGGELDEYSEVADGIKSGDWEGAEEKVMEKAGGIEEVDYFKEQSSQFDHYKAQQEEYQKIGEQYQDKEFLKKEGKEKAMEAAKDYFATQQGKLYQAHQKLAKLKSKHNSLPSIKDIPRQKNYFLQRKSLRERLDVGFSAEINKIDYTTVDIAPSVGYDITEKIQFYVAYMYRLNINDRTYRIDTDKKTYGPRVFITYDIIKGFHGKLTYESIRTDIPRSVGLAETSRRWVPGVYVGIGKSYNLSSKIRGNAEVLYNLKYSSDTPYPGKFNIRFGFNFALKSQGKSKAKTRLPAANGLNKPDL